MLCAGLRAACCLQLLEVPGRGGVVITPEQPIGEFAELEEKGAAPFLLQRYRWVGCTLCCFGSIAVGACVRMFKGYAL